MASAQHTTCAARAGGRAPQLVLRRAGPRDLLVFFALPPRAGAAGRLAAQHIGGVLDGFPDKLPGRSS